MELSNTGPHPPERALDEPRVSIVICNYNYDRHLEQALSSALAQTHAAEIIAVDDGSTDRSRDILTTVRDRVKVVLQANGGQRSAYQTGFEHSSGEFVFFLDADDFLDPDAVTSVLSVFADDVAKVHYRMRLVDDRGQPLGPSIPSRLARGDVAAALQRWGLLYASAPGSGNAYRRSAIAPLFPLPSDPKDRHGADYFLIYGCVFSGRVAAVDATLAAYRVHGASLLAEDNLVFGNAASNVDPQARFVNRSAQLRAWLHERTEGRVQLPDRLLDFSQQKAAFAHRIFNEPYLRGLLHAGAQLPDLLESVWRASTFSPAYKAAISTWALTVLLAPRPIGRPLTRYVSNPASRSRGQAG